MKHVTQALAQQADRAHRRLIAGMCLLVVAWAVASCAAARTDLSAPRELGEPIHTEGK